MEDELVSSVLWLSFVLNIPRNRNYRAILIVPAASFLLGDMTTIFELLEAPLRIFQGLGLSPFQAFVVIGMLSSGVIMNWTFNFNSHEDDDDDGHQE